MNSEKWSRYFDGRRDGVMNVPWSEPLPGADPGFAALRELLPQLGCGEGMEGRLGDTLAAGTRDETYAHCLRAYAEEERSHGEMLARLGERYGCHPIERGDLWIRLVIWLVNLGPLMLRVLMLYTGEIVAVVMYEYLLRHSPDSVVRGVLRSILQDERGHIAFHGDRLRSMMREGTSGQRRLIVVLHRLGFALVVFMLYMESRHVMRCYGAEDFRMFVKDCRRLRDQTATGQLAPLRGRPATRTLPPGPLSSPRFS